MVLWSQDVLYGGPFNAGYPGWEEFFNIGAHPGEPVSLPTPLVALHTPLVIAGVAGAVPMAVALSEADPDAARLALGLFAIALMNLRVVPAVSPLYDVVWSLRFMLPAMVAMFVLLAAICVMAARTLSRWHKALTAGSRSCRS